MGKRYRIGEQLGEGGMAVVHRGWHTLFEQPIAIKILKPDYWQNSEAVARFLDEARSLARLRGVHVPHVLDIGRFDSGAPFMVTELLDGKDLGRLLAAHGPLPVERAVELVVAACDAVAAAHEKGIVHRDLKPENLFLVSTAEGTPLIKVLDFGVAKRLDAGGVLDTKRTLGSPHYMAPEQIATPAEVDARADIWSLGVVLFELLTGRVPFDGANVRSVCLATLRAECPPPSSLRPELPADVEAVILKCLEKRPERRFASASALKAALEALSSSEASRERNGADDFETLDSSEFSAIDEAELEVPITVCVEPDASAAPADAGEAPQLDELRQQDDTDDWDVVTDSSVILEKPRARRLPGSALVATAAAAVIALFSTWPPARELAREQAAQAHAASMLAIRAARKDMTEMRRWGEIRLALPQATQANSAPAELGVVLGSPPDIGAARGGDHEALEHRGQSTSGPVAKQAVPARALRPAERAQGLKRLPTSAQPPQPQSHDHRVRNSDLIDPYPDH